MGFAYRLRLNGAFSINLRFCVVDRSQVAKHEEMKVNFAPNAAPFLIGCLLVLLGGCQPKSDPPVLQAPEISNQIPRLRALDFKPFEKTMATVSEARIREIADLLQRATIPDLQEQMKQGKVSSEELTSVCLLRIQRLDARLRSYIELNQHCLEDAKAADRARKAGQAIGPLHGIPINVKDNIGTVLPLHTTVGAEILLDHSPSQDAAIVTQLRKAGAVILGKASLSELAGTLTTEPPGYNAVSGIGVNPYGETFPVSGSSSGSAISVSAGLAVVSVGTETSGSLISPASMNGVVAMKPSLGLVSGQGIVPLIRYQDSAGPIARNVTDAALLLAEMDLEQTDYLTALKPDALSGVKVGVLRSAIQKEKGPWLSRIDEGLRVAKAVSLDVEESFESKPNLLPVIFLGLSRDTVGYMKAAGLPVSTIADLKAYNLAKPDTRMPRGQNMIDLGAQILKAIVEESHIAETELGDDFEQAALAVREEAAALLAKTFADHQVEVLVSLSNQHSELYAPAGYPAITVPLGLNPDGAPNGVTFVGKRGDDVRLIAFAYAFEQATRLRVPPPL